LAGNVSEVTPVRPARPTDAMPSSEEGKTMDVMCGLLVAPVARKAWPWIWVTPSGIVSTPPQPPAAPANISSKTETEYGVAASAPDWVQVRVKGAAAAAGLGVAMLAAPSTTVLRHRAAARWSDGAIVFHPLVSD
jgi:hypothetical protein